jgi:hypothetical protein
MDKEGAPPPVPSPERRTSLGIYKALFIQRDDVHSVQRPHSRLYYVARNRDETNKPLTDEILPAHLRGDITINLQSIDRQGTTRWSVLDSDNGLFPIQDPPVLLGGATGSRPLRR